jgi:hypothetical protein
MSAKSDNALVALYLNQLPSVQIGSNDDFDAIAKSSEFLGRLQLYTKGKAVNKGLVRPGHYGIPESDEDVLDLGDSINLLVLARRPKAIDMTDTDAVICVYDVQNPEFQRIQAQSAEKESHCMYGPSFLVYEESSGRFLEFFCGSKSARSEAKKIFPYLPLSQAAIDTLAAKNEDTTGLVAHGPLPLTLKSKLVEKGTYSWHVPVALKCVSAFTRLPKPEATVREIQRFLTIQGDQGTTVKEPEGKKRAR